MELIKVFRNLFVFIKSKWRAPSVFMTFQVSEKKLCFFVSKAAAANKLFYLSFQIVLIVELNPCDNNNNSKH